MRPNSGHRYANRVPADAAGRTLVDFLVRYRHSSRREWTSRIREGRVRVDGRRAEPGSPLRAGQFVEWHRPPWVEPPAPLEFEVLGRDGSILAVMKPAGLPTLPGGGFLTHTLLHQVRRRHPRATPVHRLGRFTSGIVLFALDDTARRSLSSQWRRRRVHKRYLALASGRPRRGRFTVGVPIGPIPHPRLGRIHAADPCGRSARTDVSVIGTAADRFLARVTIETGRPHQIRIHLSAAGYPLLGEPLWVAGGRPTTDALPGDGGYHLHAQQLGFDHPGNGHRMVLDCAPPPGSPLADFWLSSPR